MSQRGRKKVSAQLEKKIRRLPGQMSFRTMGIQNHCFYSVKSAFLTFGCFQILKNIWPFQNFIKKSEFYLTFYLTYQNIWLYLIIWPGTNPVYAAANSVQLLGRRLDPFGRCIIFHSRYHTGTICQSRAWISPNTSDFDEAATSKPALFVKGL